MKTKTQDEKFRREYLFPYAFKDAKTIRDGKVRQLKDLLQIADENTDINSVIRVKKSELIEIDFKIDILELLYKSVFGENVDSDKYSIGVEGSKSVPMTKIITGVLTNSFDWYSLIPFKDNIDYLGSIYMLLFGENVCTPNTADLVIQSQLKFFVDKFYELDKLKNTGKIKPKDYDVEYNELKERLLRFIIGFTGYISIEDLFKSFNFTTEEMIKIIRSYSMYKKHFDWYEYFIGRYYNDNLKGLLFDTNAIETYLNDDASIKEKEEFIDSVIEFIERLDREQELCIDKNRLYTDEKYLITSIDELNDILDLS